MLTVLPSLIYFKDSKGRYAFCSQKWRHLTNRKESIRGKTDFEIRRSKKNAKIARESDLEVLKSGVGKSYVIKEKNADGSTDFLQIIKEPLKNEKGEAYGIIAIINNVTEEEITKQELREKSITDQLTGLYNRVFFEELTKRSQTELNYPLTMITADCDGLKEINDQFGHAAGDKYICFAKSAIQSVLPKDTYIFRMGGDEFLAIVPRTNSEQAKEYVKKIRQESKKYKNDCFSLKLSVGSYTIDRKGNSIEDAVIESDKEMYRSKNRKKRAAMK